MLAILYVMAIGLLPYHGQHECLPGGVKRLEVTAMFWLLTIRFRPSGNHDWTLRVPLILYLRHSLWAVIEKISEIKVDEN
jgi:hypothetical protein